MPIAINGSGSITGISVGGIPDGTVDTDVLAANAVTYAKIGTTEQGQLCKAWVNFNGTSTVAIRASYNVSSITDNGVDDYTVNFSNALVDANYVTTISVNQEDSNTYSQHFGVATASNASYSLKSASQVRMRGRNTISSNYDPFDVSVAIFR
jgi:hypothetical protein